MGRYLQGYFKPKNPSKYKGNVTNIVYRSSYELKLMKWCDSHPHILEWNSESIAIPYVSPLDGKYHRYFVDMWVKKQMVDGTIECVMIEVKARYQTVEPTVPETKQARTSKRYLREVTTWMVNNAKWEAARRYCEERKWKFIVLDEYSLGIKQ